jgi:hypothetical protein
VCNIEKALHAQSYLTTFMHNTNLCMVIIMLIVIHFGKMIVAIMQAFLVLKIPTSHKSIKHSNFKKWHQIKLFPELVTSG